MSLILEALKKSEAERRLGRAPDLLTPIMTTHPARRPIRWIATLAIAVTLTGLTSWWWFGRLATPAPELVIAEPAPSATTATPPPAAELNSHSVTEPSTKPAPMQVTARSPTETIANVPVPQDPDFHGTERESMAVPATAIPLAQPSQDTVVRPVTMPTQAPATTPELPQGVAPVAEPTAETSVIVAEPELEALPRLALLLPVEREGLPPLRLSMHVYDPDPSARFVLIDGKRYRQGDAIAQGVVVDTIRVDGAAISWRGRRFLLPRP